MPTRRCACSTRYIRGCDAVVAIMGACSGTVPPPAAAAPFAHMLPPGIAEASYTQWEIIFARYYRRRLSFYVAAPEWPSAAEPCRPELQAALRRYLFEQEGLNRKEGFTTDDGLCRQVLAKTGPITAPASRCIRGFAASGPCSRAERPQWPPCAGPWPIAASRSRSGVSAASARPGSRSNTASPTQVLTALLFASGETPEALDANLANLSGVLRLGETEAREDTVRLQAVLDWLQAHPNWLLILDNLDTPEALKAAEARLAPLTAGHVIATSRLSNFSALFEALELDVLDTDAAPAFLLDRTQGKRRALDDDPDQARAIANEDLGGLALALEQAGAYIAQRRQSFAQYRQDWAAQRDEVLAATRR